MKTATPVKALRPNNSGAVWKIYKLDPPMNYDDWGEGPQTISGKPELPCEPIMAVYDTIMTERESS